MKVLLTTVAITLLAFSPLASLQARQAQEVALNRSDALTVISFVAVAEVRRAETRRNLPTAALASMLPGIPATRVDDQTVRFAGYTLRIRRADSGADPFVAALIPDVACAPAWFVDRTNTVYQGVAITCRP